MPMETTGIRELVRKLELFPVELEAELTPAVLEGAQIGAAQVRENAGFSSRIPDQVTTSANFSRSGGAEIRTKAGVYPHVLEARVLEGDGISPQPFRHPVKGSDNWVTQMTHPFQGPAIREKHDEIVAPIAAAVHKALN